MASSLDSDGNSKILPYGFPGLWGGFSFGAGRTSWEVWSVFSFFNKVTIDTGECLETQMQIL